MRLIVSALAKLALRGQLPPPSKRTKGGANCQSARGDASKPTHTGPHLQPAALTSTVTTANILKHANAVHDKQASTALLCILAVAAAPPAPHPETGHQATCLSRKGTGAT